VYEDEPSSRLHKFIYPERDDAGASTHGDDPDGGRSAAPARPSSRRAQNRAA
jgi:hypothetical protein